MTTQIQRATLTLVVLVSLHGVNHATISNDAAWKDQWKAQLRLDLQS
jgi:hypothetical protein